jgi:hypothetical protein
MKRYILLLLVILSKSTANEQVHHANPDRPLAYFQGTLFELTSECVSPGSINFEPYFFFTNYYGVYTSNWSQKNALDHWELNQQYLVETGITDWMDVTITPQTTYNQTNGQESTVFGDTLLDLGFQLLHINIEDGTPNLRLQLSELFPTGKYKNLSSTKEGTDSGGAGSYQTLLALIYEQFFMIGEIETFINCSALYNVALPTNVRGYNTYGGATDTLGKVNPGNSTILQFATQIAINRHWIFATDFVLAYTEKTTFSGNPGTIDGEQAVMDSPESFLFTITPQIAYGIKPNLGIIIGGWVSVAGKNTSSLASLVIAVNYTWSDDPRATH